MELEYEIHSATFYACSITLVSRKLRILLRPAQRSYYRQKYVRSFMRPVNIVLRTNLAMPLDEDDLCRIASAFDQVVVSVDGNEKSTSRGIRQTW